MTRLVLAAFAACILAAPAAVADSKYIKIIHVKTGKVLAVDNDSDEAGARVVLAPNDDSKARQWRLEKDGDCFKLTNRLSGKVLDVFEEANEAGAPIIVWDDKPKKNANQRWLWHGNGKDRRLQSKPTELVLDIDEEDRVIQQKRDEKAKSQLWRVVEVKE
jgi:hypothetical protein